MLHLQNNESTLQSMVAINGILALCRNGDRLTLINILVAPYCFHVMIGTVNYDPARLCC